jgi:hypothetical protein
MRCLAAISLGVLLSACATSSQQFDRNTPVWAQTIIACQSAAQLVGTDDDKEAWAYERRAYLADRNGGWKSDPARLSNAVTEYKEQLLSKGETAPSNQMSICRDILVKTFPGGQTKA